MIEDRRGISVMHDAVLFSIMISMAGVIMLPALITDVPGEIYTDKKMNDMAQDILIELMNCRVEKFEYKNLGGIFEKQHLLNQLTDILLRREQLHKTYADIVTECLSSQLEFNGKQYNILTKDYTKKTKELLKNFFDTQLGLNYNLTVIWRPIEGIDFGGKICVGETPPNGDIYVATTYFSMPSNFINEVLGNPINELENELLNILDNEKIDKERVHKLISRVIEDTVSNMVEVMIDSVGNDSSKIVDEVLTHLHMDPLSDRISRMMDSEIEDKLAKNINTYFEENISPVIDRIIDEGESIVNKIIELLLNYIDFYRAKATLIIWRG
ncbi:MAG: hypothetical protein J7K61_05695 [Thermoplasmata archaeon]|nr:hypothetical protein [Thermoplasmata archaeon]